MTVRLFLASGDERVIEGDTAQMDGSLFMVSEWDPRLKRRHTVLTLRSQDIIRAEIQKDDGTTEIVLGAGLTPRKE